MPQQYPFSAVVSADDMTLALVLVAVSPEIGGVLVRGEKGTAKSTAVRALAAVLPPIEVREGDRFSVDPADPSPLSPDAPYGPAPIVERPVRLVELPVGATEDRVLGSLDLQRVLGDGVARYEPGLLARAHRGILYVDEVNLLHDHLVDVLLDAAATGRASVERDGVSVEHAARFVLIGTMNPEEGELRPQLLDRFGLAVDVTAPTEPAARAEVVRRRIAYDADPDAFVARFAADEADLRERVVSARDVLAKVDLDDETLLRIAEICAAFGVDGLRADIVMARTAVAHAAWEGRSEITTEDLRVAARLALPHRRRRNPFDAPGMDEDQLDDLLPPDEEPDGPDDDPGGDGGDGGPEGGPEGGPPPPSTTDAPDQTPDQTPGGPSESPAVTAAVGETYRTKVLRAQGVGVGTAGRRSRAVTDRGRRIGAAPHGATEGSIHLVETIRAAAPQQAGRGRVEGPLALHPDDLRRAVREGHESNLVLFCVDASGSMAARRRMEAVKTAIMSLLLDAYQRRDKVGLITFRGSGAELVLPPTGSVEIAAKRLRDLPAGGRTPLAEALVTCAEVVRVERLRDPRRRPLLVLVTDGRATSGAEAVARSQRAATMLAESHVATVVVDCETGRFSLGLARTIAGILGAEHLSLADVSADALTAIAQGVA